MADSFHEVKAMAAFYSGEMKDTVQMNPAGAYGEFRPMHRFVAKRR